MDEVGQTDALAARGSLPNTFNNRVANDATLRNAEHIEAGWDRLDAPLVGDGREEPLPVEPSDPARATSPPASDASRAGDVDERVIDELDLDALLSPIAADVAAGWMSEILR